jgi:prepilin-type processing-associated H-X9-DG protein
LMYCNDNGDQLPGWASLANGFFPEDWIYWRNPPATMPDGTLANISRSPIVLVTGAGTRDTNGSIFRCPLDKNANSRPYPYSYSINAIGVNNGVNVGMSSSHDGNGFHPFKLAWIRRASDKIMLAEEAADGTPAENPTQSTKTTSFLVDGRWEPKFNDPSGDSITVRHTKGGNITFGDGHVQHLNMTYFWSWSTNRLYVDATF